MFKKLFNFIMILMIVIGFHGCDQAEMPNIGGDIVGPGELFGCEGANFYDWDDLEFATSLEEGDKLLF
jgi:hypothetical protein